MPPNKPPTIYDVAEHAGVSITTVSRMINTPDKVNGKTRERIIAAIDALGFVPKAEARARAMRGTRRIGVISPFFTAPSFVQRLQGIAEALSAKKFELVIYTVDSADRLKSFLSSVPLTGNLDGLIILALPVDDVDARRLVDHGLDVEDVRVHTLERMRRIFAWVLVAAQFVFTLTKRWPPQAMLWLRKHGGKLGFKTDRDGPYILLRGLSAVFQCMATLSWLSIQPFPHHLFGTARDMGNHRRLSPVNPK